MNCYYFQESEITDMRQTIELLKKQSIQVGLTSAHMQSMGQQVNGKIGSDGSPSKKSLNGSLEAGLHNGNGAMQRHLSTDSVCSINSNSSTCSGQDKKKKKGWVSETFNRYRNLSAIFVSINFSFEAHSRKHFHAMPKSQSLLAR